MIRRAGLVLAVAALSFVAFGGGVARAQEFSGSIEPSFSHVETDVTDQAGLTSHQKTDLLTQKYRLSLDRTLTNYLSASAGGTLTDDRAWIDTDGAETFAKGQSNSLYGRLTLGTPTLTGGVGADRREQRGLGAPYKFITESYTGYASWRPKDLPELDLRASHTNTYDPGRHSQDTTNDNAQFGARYNAPEYDLRYLLSWNRSRDHLRDSDTTSVEQTVLGNRSDRIFGGRTSTYVSGTVQTRNTFTASRGQGGLVTRQQLPVAGLSAVEILGTTPDNIALSPNPLVIDGNTTTSASINVGFGPAAVGDVNLRDVGAGFADTVTAVNTVYVWVDRQMTAEVGRALAAGIAVYQSDDNQRWTPVPVLGPPVVSPIENRIEITISQTQARYLKVTLRPIATGVTIDASFRDLFVTEAQFLLILPAELVPKSSSSVAAKATASARTMILREPDFSHDITASVARQTEGSLTTYSLVNGLSAGKKITEHLVANARGSRQDQDTGRGHEAVWQWSAALVANPLQTAYWTLTYSGTARNNGPATHSLSALGRADWYEGISTQANAGVAISYFGDKTTKTGQASGTATFTPNTVMTLTLGGQYSRSLASSPDLGDIVTEFARADASVTLTPAPAMSAAGTVSRVFLVERPTTLATLQLNYFPLRGDLQLSVAYSRTLDTAAEATTQLLTPSLRWNLRRGVSLTSSYTLQKNDSPAQMLDSRAFVTTLLITL